MKYLSAGLVGSPAVAGVINYPSVGGSSSVKTEKETDDKKETSFTDTTGTRTTQLKLDQSAIDKTVADLLSGTSGLASIFQAENAAGIFDSTGAAGAAGDLTAKIAGEIAKLTGENVTTIDETSRTETESQRIRRQRDLEAEAHAGVEIL